MSQQYWPWGQGGEGDLVLFVGLLDTRRSKVLQDHLGEGLFWLKLIGAFIDSVDQFVVLIHSQHAMRREALHGERSRDADLLFVLVRFTDVCRLFEPVGRTR